MAGERLAEAMMRYAELCLSAEKRPRDLSEAAIYLDKAAALFTEIGQSEKAAQARALTAQAGLGNDGEDNNPDARRLPPVWAPRGQSIPSSRIPWGSANLSPAPPARQAVRLLDRSLVEHGVGSYQQHPAANCEFLHLGLESGPARQHPEWLTPDRELLGLSSEGKEYASVHGCGTPLTLPNQCRAAAPQPDEIDLILAIPPAPELAELCVDVVRP